MSDDLDQEHRLAIYGSLAPGRANHHQLDGLVGRWSKGAIRGRLVEEGWGARLGYPAVVLDPHAGDLEVFLFESRDLPDHWARLDAFEGPGYQRVATTVRTATGSADAYVYALADQEPLAR